MTEFENIVIGKSAIPSLAITVILMIAIPVIFFICWRKKQKQQTKIGYLIAGAVGFIVSARTGSLKAGALPISRFLRDRFRT